MMTILRYVDARLGEPSTWASIAMLLGMAGISLDSGTIHLLTIWGSVFAAVLGVVLSEAGTKPTSQVVLDALAALVAGVKAMPADAVPVQAPASPAAANGNTAGGVPVSVGPTAGAAIAVMLAAGLGLVACSPQQAGQAGAQASADIAKVQADAQTVLDAYGVAKGIALVAESADPSLAPAIGRILGVTDPLAATLQLALADATADLPQVQAETAQLNQQLLALQNTAAPAVKVVAGK